jgi:hypothetical protein
METQLGDRQPGEARLVRRQDIGVRKLLNPLAF